MIVSHFPDVNPNDYCYETNFKFGIEFGERLLHEVTARPDQFAKKVKYNRGDSYKDLVKLVGPEKARELNRRKLQFRQYNPNQKPINFLQLTMPKFLEDEFYGSIPSWLFEIDKGFPVAALQVSSGGDYLPTHMGHPRQSSLFMLLQGQEQETRWYRNTSDFPYIDPYRIPDHDKIEHIVTAIMEPFKWYVFNHRAWHSVHKFTSGGSRVNVGLDFDNVPMSELVKRLTARQ